MSRGEASQPFRRPICGPSGTTRLCSVLHRARARGHPVRSEEYVVKPEPHSGPRQSAVLTSPVGPRGCFSRRSSDSSGETLTNPSIAGHFALLLGTTRMRKSSSAATQRARNLLLANLTPPVARAADNVGCEPPQPQPYNPFSHRCSNLGTSAVIVSVDTRNQHCLQCRRIFGGQELHRPAAADDDRASARQKERLSVHEIRFVSWHGAQIGRPLMSGTTVMHREPARLPSDERR
jgi:hypothetical protein